MRPGLTEIFDFCKFMVEFPPPCIGLFRKIAYGGSTEAYLA